jgi:hypothetical protein
MIAIKLFTRGSPALRTTLLLLTLILYLLAAQDIADSPTELAGRDGFPGRRVGGGSRIFKQGKSSMAQVKANPSNGSPFNVSPCLNVVIS